MHLLTVSHAHVHHSLAHLLASSKSQGKDVSCARLHRSRWGVTALHWCTSKQQFVTHRIVQNWGGAYSIGSKHNLGRGAYSTALAAAGWKSWKPGMLAGNLKVVGIPDPR